MGTEDPPPGTRKSARTRLAILDAARVAIARKGFPASLSPISRTWLASTVRRLLLLKRQDRAVGFTVVAMMERFWFTVSHTEVPSIPRAAVVAAISELIWRFVD